MYVNNKAQTSISGLNFTVAFISECFDISHTWKPQHIYSLVRTNRCIRIASNLFITASSAVIVTI